MKYLFVTGSRHFEDEVPVQLLRLIERSDVLVHGDCRGFDIACASEAPTSTDRMPVPMVGAAGPARNQVLADLAAALQGLGHSVRLATYIQPGLPCRGTRDCIRRFAKAGIKMRHFGLEP